MGALKEALKVVIPSSIRLRLRTLHRDFVFHSSMRRFLKAPEAALATESRVIPDLIYGWGNEGWSALEEYLVACLKHALGTEGDILECGSGLSTLLLGAIARQSGCRVWSLEHHPAWGQRVKSSLAKYGIGSVHLCVAPLKNYGDFTWYDAPLDAMPPNFALVVCDGPPAETQGGRFGLLPVMRSRLAPATLILLDDGDRVQEQAIAARWAGELNTSPKMLGQRKRFIEIRVPGVSAGC